MVHRNSKCWTQALKIEVSYINCFINKQQKRYIMTTIDNPICKHKHNLSFSPYYSQFYFPIPPENI